MLERRASISETKLATDAIGTFEERLHEAVKRAQESQLHGFAEEALASVPMDDREKDALAVFVALRSLDQSSRALVVRLFRENGGSIRFGDQALIALLNFTNTWSELKGRIEAAGVEIPRG